MGNSPPSEHLGNQSTSASQVFFQLLQQKLQNPIQIKHYHDLFDVCANSPTYNRALGCLFGSFIGDSLGSFLEFNKNITNKLVDRAMIMPGGGVFSVKPGQLTDDSELASHLMRGLLAIEVKKPFKEQSFNILKQISKQYISWLEGKPFDVGNTCRKGILKLREFKSAFEQKSEEQLNTIFEEIFKQIHQENKQSQSNGSLMRITPMAVLFACNQQPAHLYQPFIKNQIKLIHSHPIVQQAGYLWVDLLAQIINRKDNTTSTFASIIANNKLLDKEEQCQQWYNQAAKPELMPANMNIGWSKIAWTYGLHFLHKLSFKQTTIDSQYYKNVIRTVLEQGGDTDTNAAIVGGMLGALVGFTNLPVEYLTKMLNLTFPEPEEAIIESEKRAHSYQPFWVLLDSLNYIEKCRQFHLFGGMS